MPLNVDVQQALMLLGHKTLELETLRSQCEQIAEEFNKLKEENQVLRAQLEQPTLPGALREVR
jgi:hypothetical protein